MTTSFFYPLRRTCIKVFFFGRYLRSFFLPFHYILENVDTFAVCPAFFIAYNILWFPGCSFSTTSFVYRFTPFLVSLAWSKTPVVSFNIGVDGEFFSPRMAT